MQIRAFEEAIEEVYFDDVVESPVHLSIGQELSSVLAGINKQEQDHFVGNYRSHALTLSISDKWDSIIRELRGDKGGIFQGRAGSMHLGDPSVNMMWTSAIVGTGVPVSLGIADACKRNQDNGVTLVQFGDGAMEEGAVLESMNIAATKKLPLIFLMENNGLAIYTDQSKRVPGNNLYVDKASAFGLEATNTSLKRPKEALKVFKDAFAYCRSNCEPIFLEVECCRWRQHVGIGVDFKEGDQRHTDVSEWKKYDILENPAIVDLNRDEIPVCLESLKSEYVYKFKSCTSN